MVQDILPQYYEIPVEKNNTSIMPRASTNQPIRRTRKDTQYISEEVRIKLNILALYLSKYEHYDLFEVNLNQSETIKKIANIIGVKENTLKNKRDQYDPYCSSKRVGWVQQAKLSDDMKKTYDEYRNKTKIEMLKEIHKFI